MHTVLSIKCIAPAIRGYITHKDLPGFGRDLGKHNTCCVYCSLKSVDACCRRRTPRPPPIIHDPTTIIHDRAHKSYKRSYFPTSHHHVVCTFVFRTSCGNSRRPFLQTESAPFLSRISAKKYNKNIFFAVTSSTVNCILSCAKTISP